MSDSLSLSLDLFKPVTSDGSGRITGATDNIGRTVSYSYDANGNLTQFTDANGGITKYTYGDSSQMVSITDPKGITYLTNVYDANQRVIQQVQGDGSTYKFAYITDPNTGAVVETDLTDPLGHIRKVTFNANGFTLSETLAAGLPEQQTTTYTWDLSTNLLQSEIDPAGFAISYTYDNVGNVNSITRMAGTAAQSTIIMTYEPTFNRVVGLTDTLQHTTTMGYDS